MARQVRRGTTKRAKTKIRRIDFIGAVAASALFVFAGVTASIPLRVPSLTSGLTLVPAFVLVMACVHEYASTERKFFSRLGLLFATGYGVLIGFNYYMQLTSATQPAFLTTFDMHNPTSVM